MKIQDVINLLEQVKKERGNIDIIVDERNTGFEFYDISFDVMNEYTPDGNDMCLLRYS